LARLGACGLWVLPCLGMTHDLRVTGVIYSKGGLVATNLAQSKRAHTSRVSESREDCS